MPIDLTTAFRGSAAVAAGLVTPGRLRSRRYQRLFPDVYAPAARQPDLALRARAAGVLVRGRGVVTGYAAAELVGASSAPADAPVDVLLPSSYRCDGLTVHRERWWPDEAKWLGPTLVATPERIAYDLARWARSLTERVAAVDALAFHCDVELDAVRRIRNRHLGAHLGSLVSEVLALVDPLAASPMESRIRMALHLDGLPAPVVQHHVIARGSRFSLDLAYPHARLAIEYDGAPHRGQRRARRDLLREAALTALGWKILRFDADVVLFRPEHVAAVVRAELALRAAM
jgi:hypothetical protein